MLRATNSGKVLVFNESWVAGRIRIFKARASLSHPVTPACRDLMPRTHATKLNYARNYLATLLPDVLDRVVFIDDDVIVQGSCELVDRRR